jgi:hypothetical protein
MIGDHLTPQMIGGAETDDRQKAAEIQRMIAGRWKGDHLRGCLDH